MSAWKEKHLGDVLDLFDSRRIPLSSLERESIQGQHPYYGASGIIDYLNKYIFEGNYLLIAEDGENLNSRKLPIAFWARGKFWVNNHAHIAIGKTGHADTDFIRYCFASADISGFVTGTAQPKLSQGNLKKITFRFPDFLTQQKIAAVLSGYDQLIENNKRRIALLEKLAEEIYREWFVRFRFPGHEKAKSVKGVPQGWRVAMLREIAGVNLTSINRQSPPDTVLYVDISSVSTNRIEETTSYPFKEAPGRARRKVQHGDIIWSSVRPANRAYCLIFNPPENLIVSTGFAVIRPNSQCPFTFLYFAVTSNPFVDQMTTVAKGAAYPATSFDDFEKAKLLIPTDELLKLFHEKAEPMFRQKHLLQQQSDLLKQSRDLLLPRLISGKLSVEDLAIQYPPGMAAEMKRE